jgi:uncharacterized protein YacL
MLFGAKKTYVMDLDTMSDPRIAEFLSLGLVLGQFLLPEPPPLTDADNDHRSRRAQETVDRLKAIKGITVKLDRKLVTREGLLAALRKNKATLITASADLKAAASPLPAVLTLDIYQLFKPTYLPGTELKVRIAKKGKEKNEGIGYLEGGIKVVVEHGASALGSEIEVVISGALDTDVGRVVFARPRFAEVR